MVSAAFLPIAGVSPISFSSPSWLGFG